MNAKTKILTGILVTIVLVAGGWWVWKNRYLNIYCDNLGKRITTEIDGLDTSCQVNQDCKTVELLRAIRLNGAYPICVNKREDAKKIRSLQDLQRKICKDFLPHILITPVPFYGCDCKNNVCTATILQENECSNLDNRLYQVFQSSEPSKLAQELNLSVKDGKIRVVIVLDQEESSFLEDFGLEIETQRNRDVQALVPIDQLCNLANTDGVVEIRVPARGLPLQ